MFHKRSSVLFVSLMLLLAILSVLFLTKDRFIQQHHINDFYNEKYLLDRNNFLSIDLKDKDEICRKFKKYHISLSDLSMKKFYFLKFSFNCQFHSLFKNRKPTKEKYIQFTKLEDYLDLSNLPKSAIFYIRSLSELPMSSENDPKIVIALNEIDESLPYHFYGIVITDYLFNIKGKKMYGVLYSSFDNAREERNLTFRKAVLDRLETKYSDWTYLTNSTNMLGSE